MAALNVESLNDWWRGLQQHLLDQGMTPLILGLHEIVYLLVVTRIVLYSAVLWKHTCESTMEMPVKKKRVSAHFQRDQRAGSLYDKTRVKRSAHSQVLDRHHIDQDSSSPLTMAFNRFTKNHHDDKSGLSRNHSYPK